MLRLGDLESWWSSIVAVVGTRCWGNSMLTNSDCRLRQILMLIAVLTRVRDESKMKNEIRMRSIVVLMGFRNWNCRMTLWLRRVCRRWDVGARLWWWWCRKPQLAGAKGDLHRTVNKRHHQNAVWSVIRAIIRALPSQEATGILAYDQMKYTSFIGIGREE